MTETAKERIYREKLELISDKSMWHMNFKSSTIKMMMKNAKQALELAENLPDDTDKLSVEKLQEHLLPYKKETVQKIIDEKMQLVTADEFLKLHKESLTAIRENDKLQEQLNTAKKALKEIRADIEEHNQIYDLSVDTALLLEGIDGIAFDALAAIGGDDD